MKKKPITHVAILLDKSGSMFSTKNAAISGYNEQVQVLKKQQEEGLDIRVSLVTFNHDIFEHTWEQSASELNEVSAEEFVPKGGTSMRDAIGFTIKKLKETTDTNDPDDAYLIYIISDGETLNDKVYSIDQLKEMVESCQKTGSWTFSYIGCDASYLEKIARETSIPMSNMAAWSNANDSLARKGIKASSTRSTKYFDDRKMGVKASCCYQSDTAGVANDYTDDTKTAEELAAGLGARNASNVTSVAAAKCTNSVNSNINWANSVLQTKENKPIEESNLFGASKKMN